MTTIIEDCVALEKGTRQYGQSSLNERMSKNILVKCGVCVYAINWKSKQMHGIRITRVITVSSMKGNDE